MRTRVVLDANIFASALMKPTGIPARVLRDIVTGTSHELVLSEPILEELQRILFYPKIRDRIQQSDQEISQFLHALSIIAHLTIQRHSYDVLVHEDPDDDIYIIAALESRAQYLVTGDQHLLRIGQLEGVKILMASDFLKL
jgi:putative PIN family toxin of toxin-antitoxin system